MQKPKFFRCSICNEPCAGYGNNPEPVNSGRCCDSCNMNVVIPTRILQAVKWLRERDHDPQ